MKVQPQNLNDVAEQEIERYLKWRADLHLEAAIGSMLDVQSTEEVATRLETEAAQLREFG